MSLHAVMELRGFSIDLAPVWAELVCVMFFTTGFFFVGNEQIRRRLGLGKYRKQALRKGSFKGEALEADCTVDRSVTCSVLASWRRSNDIGTPELLRLATVAIVEIDPESVVREIVDRMYRHRSKLCNTKAAAMVLDVLARSGLVVQLEQMWDKFQNKLMIPPSHQIYEILLGGFAAVGDKAKVTALFAQQREVGLCCTARAFSLIIKGFLKTGMADEVFSYAVDMKTHGFLVPSFVIAQLLRIAFQNGRAEEFFEKIVERLDLLPETIVATAELCWKYGDLRQGKRLEDYASEALIPLWPAACEALVKLYTGHAETRALHVWGVWRDSGANPPPEGVIVPLLTRCAEAKFLRLAEAMVETLRAKNAMTITSYSAFMKVYANSGMYSEACDLYQEIVDSGLEPDSTMYGCLMRFAAECGRTELSQKLSESAPTLSIQNYMSLIRSAAKDKDVDRAFSVFRQLQRSGLPSDLAVYNSILDVCVSAGRMDQALVFITEMKALGELDVVTYNTLLKGYCSLGRFDDARLLLEEMESSSPQPNDVSYNCLINAAVQANKISAAWQVIDGMERRGISPDHFTVSIMLKSLKRPGGQSDAHILRAFALLDRSGFDPCSDDILLIVVLDTCVRKRDWRRLENVIEQYRNSTSGMRPSVPTCGCLIKACSALKWIDVCWQFWNEMVYERGISPNDIVVGIMLDALVSNDQVDNALALFEEWRRQVPPNTIIYCTLIKGLAMARQAPRAMKLWRDIREEGVEMNTVLYNALIDSQARAGAVREVSELVESMPASGCKPDLITYSTMLKAYCVKGDLDKAFEIYRELLRGNAAIDCVIYNTMLDGCTRHDRPELADVLLDDMDKRNIRPSNSTLGVLVKMYDRRNQLDRAFEAVAWYPKEYGFTANAQVFTCLMGTCINHGELNRAVEVFEDLKRTGETDAKAYTALINGCVSHGAFEKAVELAVEACNSTGDSIAGKCSRSGRRGGRSHLLDGDVAYRIVRTLSDRRLYSLGKPLVDRLRSCGMSLDSTLVHAFDAACGSVSSVTCEPSNHRQLGRVHVKSRRSCRDAGRTGQRQGGGNGPGRGSSVSARGIGACPRQQKQQRQQ
eukprot:TRINITY_DN22502_c1_g2_i1.p1 TRINITY_DN22502_c1_g2~~TRINITY_DN22502_c1_g2_i1.p1  ORF type:complete len:1096 (+),score=167.44 TRINITY_DN22502_c1_g2_i1:147-3434(+)